ncbi:hypothetical protein [Rhodophyticola sp. CCM32]|uniref:hypothetical protein n=1 Tax=Rhodophyticola sp. CCM32 TaxID=2916397 RepID=UPI00143D858F|nr:hypothetical protein [Rhodophyticola sp. CCM32]
MSRHEIKHGLPRLARRFGRAFGDVIARGHAHDVDSLSDHMRRDIGCDPVRRCR